jgi:nitrile hydratase beta subunit
MDSIADMGGTQGWGKVPTPKQGPPFAEPWEGRAFALALLTMGRISGRNLDAFRHALERLHPVDYLVDGYYGRWLNASELMLIDSSIIAPGAIEARARTMRGEGVTEPPVPEPNKPDYAPTAAGSWRAAAVPARVAGGDAVLTRDVHPTGHTRFPRYLRRRRGVVRGIRPAALLPDTHAHFQGENPQYVYSVAFDSHELWGPEAESFELAADLYESYLEADA